MFVTPVNPLSNQDRFSPNSIKKNNGENKGKSRCWFNTKNSPNWYHKNCHRKENCLQNFKSETDKECLTRSYGNKSWFELLLWRKNYAHYEGRTMLNRLRRNVDAWRWNTVQILIRSWWTNLVFIFTSTETSLCDWVEMTDWFGKRHTKKQALSNSFGLVQRNVEVSQCTR